MGTNDKLKDNNGKDNNGINNGNNGTPGNNGVITGHPTNFEIVNIYLAVPFCQVVGFAQILNKGG